MTQEPRRLGLVLGAGGVLGAAWTIGAMAALEEA
jgi:predicted acylesterase/phospholipase RssA